MRTSGRARKPSSKIIEMQGVPEDILSDEDDDICVNAMKLDRFPIDRSGEPGLPTPAKRSHRTANVRRSATPYPLPDATSGTKERGAVSSEEVISIHDSDSDKGVAHKRGNAFIDDEAIESANLGSDIEEDQDRYESDFIDDGPILTSPVSLQLPDDDDSGPFDGQQRKRAKLGSPFFLEENLSPSPTKKRAVACQDVQSTLPDFTRAVHRSKDREMIRTPRSSRRSSNLPVQNNSETMSRYSSPIGSASRHPRPRPRVVETSSTTKARSTHHRADVSKLSKGLSKSEQLNTEPKLPHPSKKESESSGEHSAYSNERRKERGRSSSQPSFHAVANDRRSNDGSADENYTNEDILPLPDDDWLRESYNGLPKLKYVLLEKTSKNQKERVDDSLLSPSRIKACFEKNGLDYIQNRLFKMLTMKHYKLYANASRIDPSMIKASSSGSSTFFNSMPSMYRPTERSLSNNICFVMTGMVAYSYLTEEAVNVSSYKTTADHRIGLYPFDGEFQRAMTLFGNLAGKDSLVYTFHGGVIPFTTRIKVGNEDQGNIVASPKKAGLFATGMPSQPSGCNPLLSNIKRKHYPMPLAFDDKVPVFDARRKDRVFDDSDWDELHRFPIWTHDEVPPYCLVTIGYTANTYTISTNYSANTSSPYLSLNLQFVIVHSDPVTV
ncbi:hypothetical protein CC2G_006589 [Coprinopsis cinerea AmutBmut pab1-1]|nr:hypothetical protein CC2G_006589 [Coprinopsis cinerea AmutBmut pab1-1]